MARIYVRPVVMAEDGVVAKKAKKAKVKLTKEQRHDIPMKIKVFGVGIPLTKKEYMRWSEGLRILRNRGIDAKNYSFNQMKEALVELGFMSAQNW